MLERLPEPNRLTAREEQNTREYINTLLRILRMNLERLDATNINNTAIFDEEVQDAIGTILVDTATIDFTYDDVTPAITADLKDTTVVPGSYTNTDLTVDAQGRITAASSGTDSDYLSGVYYIGPGETITVPIYRQMITKESLTLFGTLVVNGQYFLEN